MPSSKPDKQEIRNLRARRRLFTQRENLFAELFFRCRTALGGGYITPARASALCDHLSGLPEIARLFPNNVLLRLLRQATEKWEPRIEASLLDFIAALYLGRLQEREPVGAALAVDAAGSLAVRELSSEEDAQAIRPPDCGDYLRELSKVAHPMAKEVLNSIFDARPPELDLRDRFVGFTGAFNARSRKDCFDHTRRLGGVPSEPEYFLDYLFVSEVFVADSVVSSQMERAISLRRLYGNPLILTEADWLSVAT